MNIVILGGNEYGRALARIVVADGHPLTLVEEDRRVAQSLADELDARVLATSVSAPTLDEEIDFDRVDALVAVADEDADNLLAMFIAREAEVEHLVSVVHDRGHAPLFGRLGVDLLADPERVIARELYGRLSRTRHDDSVPLPGGTHAYLLGLGDGSPLIGVTPEEAATRGELPDRAVIASVRRQDRLHIPPGRVRLQAGDQLTIVTDRQWSKAELRRFGE